MSESARGEGGRVWVPRKPGDTRPPSSIPENERWYFLEEKYPAYGNLVPRDIATREIFQVCIEGKGVGGENQVYLDLTHIPAETLDRKLGAILEIYEMFVGDDPRHVPMRIFPGVHYSMGGLWVDYQSAHKYSRTACRRRMRLLDSRRESSGRKLARELRLWWLRRGACGDRVCEER